MNHRIRNYIISNVLFLFIMYFALIKESVPVLYLLHFLIVLAFLTSFLAWIPGISRLLQEKGPPTLHSLDLFLDTFFAVWLAAFDHPFLAVLYLLHSIIIHAAYQRSLPPSPDDNTLQA
jgi:hypothetical protein